MQATISRPNARARGRGQRPSFKGIGRAVRYLMHYKRQAALPYIFLIIATLSQLAVPRMIRKVIDAVTSGYVANQVLDGLAKIPANFMSAALPKILEATGKNSSLTLEQLKVQLAADINSAPRMLINALDLDHHLRRDTRRLRVSAILLGRERIRSPLPMICAMTCTRKSNACHSPITTRTRPGN